ncbi:MAG: hypothetical protein KC422_25940 [Trueperaceae bacterium]|nr:hypothetical protein [Trueperaceae bacterium]
MKKVLIGCLGVVVVLSLVGGFLAYRFVVRPVQGVVKNVEQLGEIGELNKQVSNRSGYTPPEDGIISEEQLARYLAVQTEMRSRLSETVNQLDAKYQDFEDKQPNLGNIRDFFGAYQDILKLVIEAKRVQVEALNAQNFSLTEYAWVKREALRAAFLPINGLDLSQFGEESGIELPAMTERVPEANVELLAPYKDNLEEVIGLAFFGL